MGQNRNTRTRRGMLYHITPATLQYLINFRSSLVPCYKLFISEKKAGEHPSMPSDSEHGCFGSQLLCAKTLMYQFKAHCGRCNQLPLSLLNSGWICKIFPRAGFDTSAQGTQQGHTQCAKACKYSFSTVFITVSCVHNLIGFICRSGLASWLVLLHSTRV